MYAVVGCGDCGAFWLLVDPGEQESATCPRCGTRHRARELRRFFTSDERAAAAQERARLLAERGGEAAAFERAGTVDEQERELADAGVGDREYLEGAGIDADEVAAAGEVGDGPNSPSRSRSREEVVRDALREGAATPDAVAAYASERGVPREAAREILGRLHRHGEVTESRGRYRLL